MEFRQLRTFRAVAENLSFTKTAQKLYMAQSSVSAQIRLLEDELQVKLFDRIGRRVLLTEAGQKLFEYARRIEDMTEEIRSEVTGSKYTRGSLTIRIPETIAAVYIPKVINIFHHLNPEAKLIFINCSDLQLREELNSGRIDLAFLMTETIQLTEVNVQMLRKEKLILIASPKHPYVRKKRVDLKDLNGQSFLFPKID